jgi:hypothetical protein
MKDLNQNDFEKKIREKIEFCYWRQNFQGIDICRGIVLPCQRAIENGQCDTIADFLKEEKI